MLLIAVVLKIAVVMKIALFVKVVLVRRALDVHRACPNPPFVLVPWSTMMTCYVVLILLGFLNNWNQNEPPGCNDDMFGFGWCT